MAEKSITETIIEGLKEKGNFLANFDLDVARRDLGVTSLEDFLEDAKAVKKFGKRIADCSWNGVPQPVLQRCSNMLDDLAQPFQLIRQFDPLRASDLIQQRREHIKELREQWSKTYAYMAPYLCYAESVDSSADRYASTLAEIDLLKQKMAVELARSTALVDTVEKLAQNTGVSNHAGHFKKLADNYRITAIAWLGGAVASGLGLFIYIHYLHFQASTVPPQLFVEVLESILPRLLMVTLLSTSLIFCLRNFAAMMHNVVVNRHRQTALTTFKTFVDSTDEKDTRNAALLQSMQAIFSPQPSGFLNSDTETPQMNQVTEIVRGVAGTDK